jgi:predicted protein tyrosine phosphatase
MEEKEMKKHLLFVCSSNLDRSPCAEALFKDSKDYEAKSCGILPHAERVISEEALVWADVVFCMEDVHKFHILKHFPEARGKEIVVLGVGSEFCREDPRLEGVLRQKLKFLVG